MLTYTVYATHNGADVRAAADYINSHAAAGGYTHDLREIEGEVASCAPSIRDDLAIETRTAWMAWIDGAEGDAVPFAVSDGEDVIEAASSALGGASRDVINVRKA
jgi:hypothetical protein